MSNSSQDDPLDPKLEPAPTVPNTANPAIALAHYLSPEIQKMVEDALAHADCQSLQPQTRNTLWQRWEGWLSAQDSLALSIVYGLLILLTGFGSYLLITASLQRRPSPAYQPQAQTIWK